MVEIVLTVDIDADDFDESLKTSLHQDQCPAWKGAEEGVPLLMSLFDSYTGTDQSVGVATWFVRADNQVGHYFGNNAYLFDHFQHYWKTLANKGHEIAWHPHLYKSENGNWIQETEPDALTAQMKASVEAVTHKGWSIRSSRIGEAYFSNSIAACLSSIGITCDSTALPGRERKDGMRSIDWLTSPATPYYPSIQDYRIPGTPHVTFLEIPFSMVSVLADYDAAPLKRYIDLSFWHRSLKDGLEHAVRANTILNCIVHPSTVVPGLAAKPHGLLSYRLEEVKKNIDFIIETAVKKGVPYCFKTMSQLHNRILNEQ